MKRNLTKKISTIEMAQVTSLADAKAYYGRGIITGLTLDEELFVAYFVTGRSPSSKARKLVYPGGDNNIIYTEPTNKEILEQGNPDLLLYNALLWNEYRNKMIAVSNGKQTDSVYASTLATSMSLTEATRQWNYEPDAPNFTPRISARIFTDSVAMRGEMAIIRKPLDSSVAEREEFKIIYEKGKAAVLTTYTGENVEPLPSFQGNPRIIEIGSSGIDSLVNELEPRMGNPDYRVALAVHLIPAKWDYEALIESIEQNDNRFDPKVKIVNYQV